MAKKFKKGKAKGVPRKPQALPRSVKALLSYLGNSDVRMGASARPQQAQIAPATKIYIQMPQTAPQAQQYVRQRVAPKGEKAGLSPLAGVIQQQPVIIQQQPQSSLETDKKIQAAERELSASAMTLNRKLNVLEASQQQFRQAASAAYQEVKQDLSRQSADNVNIFDARNLAQRFSMSPSPRPVIQEQRFGGGVQSSPNPFLNSPQPPKTPASFGGAIEEEEADQLGEHLGEIYVNAVSNPEMTEIKRSRGRPKLSDEVKQQRAQARKAAKSKSFAPSAAEVSSSASLLEKRAEAGGGLANFIAVPAQNYMLKEPAKKLSVRLRSNVASAAAPDMSSQIQFLAGGGAASASAMTPRRGKTIAQLLGSTRNK